MFATHTLTCFLDDLDTGTPTSGMLTSVSTQENLPDTMSDPSSAGLAASSDSAATANVDPTATTVFDVDGDPSTFPRVIKVYLALLATPPPESDDPTSRYRLPPPLKEDSASFRALVNKGLAHMKEKRSRGEG